MPHPGPFLYHYTGAKALLSIVEKQELWATRTDFTNDRSEYSQPIRYLRLMTQQPRAEKWPAKHVEALRFNLDTNKEAVTVSFSRHDNSLTQYRMYGPAAGGYAIGFRQQYLTLAGVADIMECDYSYSSMTAWCEDWAAKFFAEAARLDDGNQTAEQISRAIEKTDLFNDRMLAQLKYKAEEFKGEDEVRLYKFGKCTHFRESRKGNFIIPYQKLKLPNEKTMVILTCGPNRDAALANASMWAAREAAIATQSCWQFSIGNQDSMFRV
jgi:hypothetical protein